MPASTHTLYAQTFAASGSVANTAEWEGTSDEVSSLYDWLSLDFPEQR